MGIKKHTFKQALELVSRFQKSQADHYKKMNEYHNQNFNYEDFGVDVTHVPEKIIKGAGVFGWTPAKTIIHFKLK